MSQNPGLFIFHIMRTLIGTLHPRDFLRKHQFGLLTILLQTHFSSLSFSLFVIDKIHFFLDMNPLREVSQISALGH